MEVDMEADKLLYVRSELGFQEGPEDTGRLFQKLRFAEDDDDDDLESIAMEPRCNAGGGQKSFSFELKPVFITLVAITASFLAYETGLRKAQLNEGSFGRDATNVKLALQQTQDNEEQGFHGLDIYVIGFAKTGTGSLRDYFAESEEVAMLGRENSDLFEDSPDYALTKLDEDFEEVPNSDIAMRAVKNPEGILNMKSLKRLVHYTTRDTKLVVGLRHPVKWFQSYYNYRLRKKKKFGQPWSSVEEFHKSHPESRFDLYMMQLGKVDLSTEDLTEMGRLSLELVPNPYKVFVFHLEQMGDENVERGIVLKSDLQTYIGLENPIESWPENKMFTEKAEEEIDICDSDYDELRHDLMVDGRVAASWIRDNFIKSEDVVVGGDMNLFLELLELWGTDVCLTE